ncbi:EscU/YscU/HrcU family type III secretion system export apparatus switch protein [Psychrobacillus sp. FSL H8-0510]|uniref:EscU/YscU/HrcU family type III secretion system export apparatus switch protein n=1 Tax=Psychrobacillus sp. FSL H8-0510 TaxID=2921394 RepID=UPI0030F8E6AD
MKDERYARKEAVAITYNPNLNDAPKIVAKGKGKIAENILARAEEFNVPVQEDASLVELLGQLDINQSIPEELYQAVAEVFAYIYKIDKEKGNAIRSSDA